MPEYVYALHDFEPENADEVPFRAGERIEVIEKDDIYGDGWWQGRNSSGTVGLFPQSYTTSIPPAPPAPASQPIDIHTSTTLHPLREETENGSFQGSPNVEAAIDDAQPRQTAEVMKATMTDVQKAIEQLGKKDTDGAHSFTFGSFLDGDSTDREMDTDHDTDHDTDADGEVWHSSAREKLAEKARLANEKAAIEDAASPIRIMAPPIAVELSDESDGDDEDHIQTPSMVPFLRSHPHITEESEVDEESVIQTPKNPSGLGNSTPLASTEFFVETSSAENSPSAAITSRPFSTNGKPVSFGQDARRSNGVSSPMYASPIDEDAPTAIKEWVSLPSSVPLGELQEVQPHSRHGSDQPATVISSSPSVGIEQTLASTPYTMSLKSPASAQFSIPQSPGMSKAPSEWTLDEVVEWLRSKGFDQLVCDKFIEQDITGDVLLELNVEELKTEIGITAFGKRKRIANCIEELRRPPSGFASSQAAHVGSRLSHSRSISSAHPSLNSPMFSSQVPAPLPNTDIYSPESPPHTGDIVGTPGGRRRARSGSYPNTNGILTETMDIANSRNSTIGLGIHMKDERSQLPSSGSEGALNASRFSEDNVIILPDDDRTAVSESEGPRIVSGDSKRRRMFGRSMESTSSKGKDKDVSRRNSKEVSTSVSLSSTKHDSEDGVTVRYRAKKTPDNKTERLSLFGNTFSGSLGKTRKPPPRYANLSENEKGDKTTLSKLLGDRKVSSQRPSTSSGSPKSKSTFKDIKGTKDRERKRSISIGEASKPQEARGLATFKAGESVIRQIGTTDFNGWMHKKGETYNHWKQRYFLLKGPHLYWLRSNDAAETKIKGYLNVIGYKVIPDENIRPGRYGFKMIHDNDRTHYFSSESQIIIRDWMKAIMKTLIDRDYTKPVMSSVNIPTIPLTVAQTMNPPPRPPSPTARAATQKALRRSNPNQLSTRDAQVLLMGNVPAEDMRGGERARIESFFTNDTVPSPVEPDHPVSANGKAPPRPTREMRQVNSGQSQSDVYEPIDDELVKWANSHLSPSLHIRDAAGSICGGLGLFRIAESIRGRPCSPPVPDGAFPNGPNDDNLDGLFRLFDFLLDNDVRMGSVSINDVRLGKREKIIQLLRALKAWEDKKKAVVQSLEMQGTGSFGL